jgi:hypothetical protein
MIEKLLESIVAGGPMFALLGFMLWLWVKQSEKHESHWVRMMNESLVVQERRATSDAELAKVLGKMELIMERVLDGALSGQPIVAQCDESEGSKVKRR